MLFEILAVGTFWFWLLVAAEVVALFALVEYENGLGATLSLVAFAAVLQWVSGLDLISFVLLHPYHVAALVVPYFVLGVPWATFMWQRLVVRQLHRHDDALARFVERKGLPAGTRVLPPELRAAWVDFARLDKGYGEPDYTKPPRVRDHRSRVIRWMSLWVFSVLLYVFKDMVAEGFVWIYNRIAGFLQRMADSAYASANVGENLKLPPPSP